MELIFCDESCHLENDGNDIMVLGALKCEAENKSTHYENIRNIKLKYGVSSWSEIKWVKVSPSKLEMYKELIDYFFTQQDLTFRAVIANGKKSLDHDKFNESNHDTWFYKMYYFLLIHFIENNKQYRIFLDIKDTLGGEKLSELHRIVRKKPYSVNIRVKDVLQIRSHESELLQLCDLLIGACSYSARNLNSSQAKSELISHIEKYTHTPLNSSTIRNEKKLNRFIWTPRKSVEH